jgi:galactose mutarotase-like enzyme
MLTLSSQSSQIQFSPTRGAIVTSLKVDGNEVLYLDVETFRDPEKNVRGGIPVLFPICGPQAEHPDQPTMKQHGFARNLPWQVKEQTSSRAVLVLSDNAETRALYPHQFQYTLTYLAQERGLRIEQRITNPGPDPMPLQYGFHPYFLAEDKSALQFDLPVSNYTDNKSDDAGEFGGFDFDREEIDWAFPDPSAHSAGFQDRSRELSLTVRYSEGYKELVFWTLKPKPFVCVEPWSSGRFAYPDGRGIDTIAPGRSLEAWVEILVS